MPEEEQVWIQKDHVLRFEEMLRVLKVGTELGIRKVRITGGEPLTRPGIAHFTEQVCQMKGIEQVGISTNGTLLSKKNAEGKTMAQQLKDAGVHSINISLDSLNREVYLKATRRDLLPQVLEGIDACLEAQVPSIRINCVLTKNQTEQELVSLIHFAHEKDLLLRFIELMPVSTKEVLKDDNFLSCGLAKSIIELQLGPLTPNPNLKTNGPSSYFQIAGRNQHIGFIGAMTNFHFCESCNKLRLTSDGKLRPCLGSYLEFDLLETLRNGCTDEDLKKLFHIVVDRKPKEHDFRTNYQPNRRMIAIGG